MAVPSPFAERPGSDADDARWWRAAVVYQVYVRSFADSNGDGIGDLPGITERLDAIAELGVDAIWLTPFYISPQNDGGYDVADYRAVDPVFGTLADAEALIARAHNVGLKVMVDIVPNHTSSMHRWFAEARAGGVEDDAWGRYHCLPGTGPDRTAPPNDWMSVFGGDAWSPVLDHDGNPSGYWYLHLFDTSQPDLNWNHPDVHREMADTLRFWFDRGVDGFRIDVAHGLVKAPGYPSLASVGATAEDGAVELFGEVEVAPYWDQPGVHDIFRAWRAIADSYDPPKAFCGEVWVSTPERQAAYVRGDELNTVFNFDFLKAPWHAPGIRAIVDHSLHANGLVGAPTTWVLSNHDVTRHASRYAQDPGLALLRARAMTAFMLALPGSAYLYQGEELGLPEVFDIAEDMRADPIFFRTAGEQLGRDGCRVPLPWEAAAPSYGFGPGYLSWLPQPAAWADYARDHQATDDPAVPAPNTTLALYRRLLALRAAHPALGLGGFVLIDGALDWVELGDDVVAYDRADPRDGAVVRVVLNTGSQPVAVPGTWRLLATSGGSDRVVTAAVAATTADTLTGPVIPADCCVWLESVSI